MNLYRIDIKICGTAYIKAHTAEEAKAKCNEHFKCTGMELIVDNDKISGKRYDDPKLPEVSMSPAISFYGPWSPKITPELMEEDLPDGE